MIRTGFSFKVAAGHTEDVLSRIQEIGWKVAPICDRGSEFGFVKYTKAAKKKELRPIYGIELAVSDNAGDDKPTTDHWRFMAKDRLRDINELVWKATENKAREPILSYKEAMNAVGVVRITGERARFENFAPAPDLYVGLSPSCSRGYYRLAKSHGHRFVAISDNYYPRADDKEFYRVMLGRFSGTQMWPMHILSDEEWTAWMKSIGVAEEDISSALANRDLVFEQCKAELDRADLLVTQKPKTLMEMCVEGAAPLKVDLSDERYGPRLERELAMIYEKKFEDYFYILADMINWARERMIVGPARGSSCGSLACYLLGITTVDPIPYDLLFERFIDTTRSDLPDVDVDFSDLQRHLVFEYAEEKYGKDRVARLGSVGTFQAKSALNQAGLSLRIPQWKIDKIAESVIQRKYGDSRASQTIEDTLNTTEVGKELMKEHPEVAISQRMEDHPSAAGQHAAGVVITERSIKDFIAIDQRTGAVMCDKEDAETLNLLKIDALGLVQLSIFERVLQLIGREVKSGWLETIPLDDPKAFEVLNRKHFAGIFQFDGAAVKGLTKAIKVDCFDDMVALTALARPGPLSSGGAEVWIKRRNGLAKIETPHPLVADYIKDTLGIIIYQEQVMQIGREVGDLTWGEVNQLRRAMSKSLGNEFFNQFGDKWKAGAMAKGMPKEVADKFWDDLCEFGSMGFNKSHSVAYGFISYWCCWFKAHYPMEFAAATLDAMATPDKQIRLLRELRDEGIDYIPVDAENSGALWEIAEKEDGKRFLVGPLSQIKGIGPASVDEILTARKRGDVLRKAIAGKLKNPVTPIDTLFPVQTAVNKIVGEEGLKKVKISTTPKPMIDCQPGIPGEVVIIAVVDRIMPSDMNALQKVAKRKGRKFTGPTMALNMYAHDDTDEMLVRIERFDYDRMAKPIVERGRPGKAIYAFKGRVPEDFRMLRVTQVRYLGETQ